MKTEPSSMKNELSWMPFASGSEAIEVLSGTRGAAPISRQAIAAMIDNLNIERRARNCSNFIRIQLR